MTDLSIDLVEYLDKLSMESAAVKNSQISHTIPAVG